jgi:uncharacterized membrane protein YeaQ/YmgE (transglycosylase-associated protein family)
MHLGATDEARRPLLNEPMLIFLAIGAAAGLIAGLPVKRSAFSVLGDIFVGVLGALAGGWPFVDMEMVPDGGLVAPIIGAVIGAFFLLFLVRLVRRAAR